MSAKSNLASFRFKGDLIDIETVKYLADLIGHCCNVKILDLELVIIDKQSRYWKFKSKSLKYTDRNLTKLDEIYKDAAGKQIEVSFELSAPLKNWEFRGRDIDASVNLALSGNINSLNFVINSENLIEPLWAAFIQDILGFLKTKGCQVLYGFVFQMDNIKMPGCYIGGIKSEYLTPEESQKAVIWSQNKKNCDKKMWDVFWMNIWHIDADSNFSADKIREIVGNENIKVEDNLVIFQLNEPLSNFDIMRYDGSRKKIHDYLKAINLLF